MKRAMEVLPVLSEAIRQVRFDARMTQLEFAGYVGIEQSIVSQWERGRRAPTTDRLLKIGSLAAAGQAKTAIVEELRVRFRDCPIVQVVG
jgi:transcriptional regulator with XRE-family HTH domain